MIHLPVTGDIQPSMKFRRANAMGAAWRRIAIIATNPDLLGVVLFCVVGLGLTINVLLRHPDFMLMSEQLSTLP
jgi:hypothetical protein